VLSLPIQALTMYDPTMDKEKSSGGVQAASINPSGETPKSNPVQGVFEVVKGSDGRLRAKFVPVATGITGATDIEVNSGLSDGAEIVTGPYKTLRVLKDGSLLKRDTSQPLTLTASGSS
jgi:HlyD family secretion protein